MAAAASDSSDLASSILARLETDSQLFAASQKLGITTQHLERRPAESFRDKPSTSDDIVKLRAEHWDTRRQELAEELEAKYRELQQREKDQELKRQQRAAKAATKGSETPAAPAGGADPSALLERDKRKMEQLAKRRTEEIQKLLDFQMKQRETEQKQQEQQAAAQVGALSDTQDQPFPRP